jgi:bifunctional DNA-binding transcriptional regulator/antitoxin component of YhaV-PrlF toxin-antitoxin module
LNHRGTKVTKGEIGRNIIIIFARVRLRLGKETMRQTRVLQVTAQGQLELPPEISSELQPGDEFVIWQEEDTIVLKRLQKSQDFSQLWQKIDELGDDPEQPSIEELTAMVKKVRHQLSTDESSS